MDTEVQSIVNWIKDARKRMGLTLTELGNQTGITHSQLSRIENGVSALTLFSIIRIFYGLNYSFTSLYSENIIDSKSPLPSIYLEEKKESYQFPVLKFSDIDSFVHFILYRKIARDFVAKWLRHFIEIHTSWTEETIDVLMDEAITLLAHPSVDNRQGSQFENLCYPIDISIEKLKNNYLSGGVLLMKDIGAYIRTQRLEKNISLRALSSQVDLSHPGLSKLESDMSDRTLFSDILKLDRALGTDGELVALAWRAGELYLGAHRIYERKEYPLPYSTREMEWIERLFIVLRIYQHYDLLDDTILLVNDLRKNAVPNPNFPSL